jgi:hypothetical protein
LNQVQTEYGMGTRRFGIDGGSIGLSNCRSEVEGTKEVFH